MTEQILNDNEKQLLEDAKIAMLGFGAQGSAEADNLRRSGVSFRLGLREGGASFKRAQEAGFEPMGMAEALEGADTVVMNLPDQVQASVYQDLLKERPVKRLVFAHGFNTHFKLIEVDPSGPRHILVAPKGAASGLRELYGTPTALPAILAVEPTNKTDEEKAFAEAYAKAVGSHPKGLTWARFKDETDCDLFSEQALLCGGVSSLLRTAYEVLVEAGYNKQTAYFETLYELKLIVDLLWKDGITGMRNRISPTARYGDVTRGDRIIDEHVKDRMREVLKEVQDGVFTKEFLNDFGSPAYEAKVKKDSEHPIEVVGKEIREKLFRYSDSVPGVSPGTD